MRYLTIHFSCFILKTKKEELSFDESNVANTRIIGYYGIPYNYKQYLDTMAQTEMVNELIPKVTRMVNKYATSYSCVAIGPRASTLANNLQALLGEETACNSYEVQHNLDYDSLALLSLSQIVQGILHFKQRYQIS